MALKRRQDFYRKGYAAGLAGKELAARYKERNAAAQYERGWSAGSHGRYLVNVAIAAERAFAEHDRGRCLPCLKSARFRSRVCPDLWLLLCATTRAYAELSPLDRAAFHAWQSHYYAEPVEASDLDLLAAFA